MSGDAVEHERKALSMMSKKRFTEINDRVSQILKDAGRAPRRKATRAIATLSYSFDSDALALSRVQ